MDDTQVGVTRQETVVVSLAPMVGGRDGWRLFPRCSSCYLLLFPGCHSRGSHAVTCVLVYLSVVNVVMTVATTATVPDEFGLTISRPRTTFQFLLSLLNFAFYRHNASIIIIVTIMGQGQSNMGPGGNKGSKVRGFSCFGRSRFFSQKPSLPRSLTRPFSDAAPTTTG